MCMYSKQSIEKAPEVKLPHRTKPRREFWRDSKVLHFLRCLYIVIELVYHCNVSIISLYTTCSFAVWIIEKCSCTIWIAYILPWVFKIVTHMTWCTWTSYAQWFLETVLHVYTTIIATVKKKNSFAATNCTLNLPQYLFCSGLFVS